MAEDKDEAKIAKVRESLSRYPQANPKLLEWNPEAKKFQVVIACSDCGAYRRVFTSDLFQVTRCVDCIKIHRKDVKAAKRAAKKELAAEVV